MERDKAIESVVDGFMSLRYFIKFHKVIPDDERKARQDHGRYTKGQVIKLKIYHYNTLWLIERMTEQLTPPSSESWLLQNEVRNIILWKHPDCVDKPDRFGEKIINPFIALKFIEKDDDEQKVRLTPLGAHFLEEFLHKSRKKQADSIVSLLEAALIEKQKRDGLSESFDYKEMVRFVNMMTKIAWLTIEDEISGDDTFESSADCSN